LAIFGIRSGSSPSSGDGNAPSEYSPEKAQKFFDHARVSHDSTNYPYAMHNWLMGLRQDPRSMVGMQGFFSSAAEFRNTPDAKRGLDKETTRAIGNKSDVERYLQALIEFALRPADPSLAVRAAESGCKLKLLEPGHFLAEAAFKLVVGDKKPRKDFLLRLADAFNNVGKFDRAVTALESAQRLDPTDGDLAQRIRQMAAAATMTRGGYEQSGQSGGFRANIRDAQGQRRLDEENRIVKTEDSLDRLVAAAKEDYEKRPEDSAALGKLADRLRERGRPEDEEAAYALYMKGFELHNAFRFRQAAGDLRIRQANRRVSQLRELAEKAPQDEMLLSILATETKAKYELEVEEFKLRSAAYPTDLKLKFELGKRYFFLERFEDAIGYFQEAQDEPSNRIYVLNYLGQSFLKTGWTDEAIEIFRRALELRDMLPETQMELRYFLLCALQSKAESSNDLAAAEEGDKLASSIAIQQINYRDIRSRRDGLKKLIAKIKGA